MGYSINEIIALFIGLVSGILEFTILAEVLMSWFSNPWKKGPFRRIIEDINRPVLGPIRHFVPTTAGLDFSPFIAIVLLEFVPALIISLLGVDYYSLINSLKY